jgi:hypothetical protein
MVCKNCDCDECIEHRRVKAEYAKIWRLKNPNYHKEYDKANKKRARLRRRKAWERECAKCGKTPKPYKPRIKDED